MGKSEVASIDKEAFPKNTIVLCSKRLFAKLRQENKEAVIRAYLLDRKLFVEEECEYLLAYLKKNRIQYLENYIVDEDYDALRACLAVLGGIKTLDECLEITARCDKTNMNFFLLSYKNEAHQEPSTEKGKKQKVEKPSNDEMEAIPVSEGKKLFKLSIKNNEVIISGYKGKDPVMNVPSKIGDNTVTEIKCCAFEEMENLKKAILPDTITKIGVNAFRSCGNLESVVLPMSLTMLEDRIFERCEKLKEIRMPVALKKIGQNVFSDCPGMADDKGFVIVKDCLFGYYGDAKIVTIPEGIKKIESFAFAGKTQITDIKLLKSLKKIGRRAFQECAGLTKMDLPAGLTGIAAGAFSGCSNLREIEVPAGIKKLEGFTFVNCVNLERIKLNANLTKLDIGGDRDFLGCKKISIHAPAGSYAETYAKEHNIPFVAE